MHTRLKEAVHEASHGMPLGYTSSNVNNLLEAATARWQYKVKGSPGVRTPGNKGLQLKAIICKEGGREGGKGGSGGCWSLVWCIPGSEQKTHSAIHQHTTHQRISNSWVIVSVSTDLQQQLLICNTPHPPTPLPIPLLPPIPPQRDACFASHLLLAAALQPRIGNFNRFILGSRPPCRLNCICLQVQSPSREEQKESEALISLFRYLRTEEDWYVKAIFSD